jgi:glycosyltransferase involved in cell wall biosynthesis
MLRRLKRFTLVLEVEELYSDVINGSMTLVTKEKKFIESADKYIFPTELLNEKINVHKKSYVVVYGTYKAQEDRNVKFDDDKIHVVYAGVLEPRKGSIAAANAASFLDNQYHIHIIGFGTNIDKQELLKNIEKLKGTAKCSVTYDGLFAGEEYIKFIQKCHIGLSVQDLDASYNMTSFPSKTLSYLANGLRVITVPIESLKRCSISDLFYFCEDNTPENIARAIRNINVNEDYDSRQSLRMLDKKFCNDIKWMLSR